MTSTHPGINIVRPPKEDRSCQQILEDPSRWKDVAIKIKEDWSRCLSELQNFEDLLEKDRLTRSKWAQRFKLFGFVLSVFQCGVAGITAFIPLSRFEIPSYLNYTLSGFTFFLSLTLWTQFNERSYRYLIVAKDSERLSIMCKSVRKMLRDVISDGRITEQERSLIRDMMGQMHRRSEEVGSMDLMMKILGGDPSMGKSSNLFFGSKKNSEYDVAFKGLSDIIDEVGRSQHEIMIKAPHVVREYRDSQIQAQIHSGGSSIIPQRV